MIQMCCLLEAVLAQDDLELLKVFAFYEQSKTVRIYKKHARTHLK